MRKPFLYAAVGISTFLLGIGIAAFFVFSSSYDPETSRDVCQRCLDVIKTGFLKQQTLSTLLENQDFQGEKVVLSARFVHDAGYTFLKDGANSEKLVPVGFVPNGIECAETEKTLEVCSGYKSWYDYSVDVEVVGYLGRIESGSSEFQDGENGFNVICVLRVNPTENELRIGQEKFETYSSWKLGF